MNIFEKFKIGLKKSSRSFSTKLTDLVLKKKIDDDTLNELEDFLIQSDVGVEIATELKNKFSNTKINSNTENKKEISNIFSKHIFEILKPLEKDLSLISKNKPCVILIAGVNGVGKSTICGRGYI